MSTRPTPVVNAATFKTIIQTAVYVLGIVGANAAQDWVSTHTAVLIAVGVAVVNVGGDLLAAFHAQTKTTPVEDPRDVTGARLVPLAASSAPAAPVVDPGGVVVADPVTD